MPAEINARHTELAQKILDIALRSGWKVGDRLVEKRLAELCNVSRTPIRLALKVLENHQIVEKTPGRGYVLALDPTAETPGLLTTFQDEKTELADQIMQDRVGRRLGDSVTISEVSRRYDAPRAAVQKALEILHAQGVLRRAEGQAWVFLPLLSDIETLQDSYEFRLVLEPQALLAEDLSLDTARAHAIRNQTDALLAHGENEIPARDFQLADFAFHDLVARSCGNHFLSETLVAHNRLRQLQRAIPSASDYRMRQALHDHMKILDYVEQGHYAAAADQMRLHLRVSRMRRPRIANRGSRALMQPISLKNM